MSRGVFLFSNHALLFWKASDDWSLKKKKEALGLVGYRFINSFEKHFDNNIYSA